MTALFPRAFLQKLRSLCAFQTSALHFLWLAESNVLKRNSFHLQGPPKGLQWPSEPSPSGHPDRADGELSGKALEPPGTVRPGQQELAPAETRALGHEKRVENSTEKPNGFHQRTPRGNGPLAGKQKSEGRLDTEMSVDETKRGGNKVTGDGMNGMSDLGGRAESVLSGVKRKRSSVRKRKVRPCCFWYSQARTAVSLASTGLCC